MELNGCAAGPDQLSVMQEHEQLPALQEPSKSKSGCASYFDSLLNKVALEHDRQVTHLRAEIALLKTDDNFGISPSEVTPVLSLVEMEEQVTQERKPIPSDWRSAKQSVAFCSEHCTDSPAEESSSSCAMVEKFSFSDLINEGHLQTGLARQASTARSAEDHQLSIGKSETLLSSGVAAFADVAHIASLTSWVGSVQSDSAESVASAKAVRMENWRNLIEVVKGTEWGCVKLDSRWHNALERENRNAKNDKRTAQSVFSYMLTIPAKAACRVDQTDSKYSNMSSSTWQVMKNISKMFVIHPFSRIRMVWDILGFMLLVHDLTMIPLQVFESSTDGLGDYNEKFRNRMDKVTTAFWTSDMFVCFLTGYYSEEGFVEISHRKIAINYIKTWFPMDFLIVSVDWVNMCLSLNSEVGYLRIGKTLTRFMRILRLLRFMKCSEQFQKMLERINSEYVLTLVGVLKLLIGMVFANHYIACGWYAMSQLRFDDTWDKQFLADNEEMSYAYLTSLHWSLTQFTPASMEVVPTNGAERTYTIVVIILAMVVFSSFVSSITGAMTHIRNVNAKKAEQDAAIRQYFRTNKISQELASQVWHFRRRHKAGGSSRIMEADLPALQFLPERMRELLKMEVYSPILQQHPFFSTYSEMCPEAMTKICNKAISERQVMAGEELKEIRKDRISRMFFVLYGMLEYQGLQYRSEQPAQFGKSRSTTYLNTQATTDKRGKSKLSEMGLAKLRPFKSFSREYEGSRVCKGEWACEVALWSPMGKLDGPFVAGDSGCEVIFIHATKFQDVIFEYPRGVNFLAKYAQGFVQRFNQAHSRWAPTTMLDNNLFNDADVLSEIVQETQDNLQAKLEEQSSDGRVSLMRNILFGHSGTDSRSSGGEHPRDNPWIGLRQMTTSFMLSGFARPSQRRPPARSNSHDQLF